MKVIGKYERDSNFTTIYACGTIYTVAHNTCQWGCVSVGESLPFGGKLTQEEYDRYEAACANHGTFFLED